MADFLWNGSKFVNRDGVESETMKLQFGHYTHPGDGVELRLVHPGKKPRDCSDVERWTIRGDPAAESGAPSDETPTTSNEES